MKTVKLGIIGMGYIGQIHLKNCMKIPNVEVFGVADLSQKALNRAKKAGVKKVYPNFESLLKEPEIDAVLIGVPTHLHLKCAIAAAEAGKDIFLEKPISVNVNEAKEIISVARKNSVKLMMGYHLRFNREFGKVKEEMNNGLFGEIENAHATFISSGPFFHRAEGHAPVPVPDWWFNKELTGGGVMVDLGCHMINLMRWYFGEITDIKAYFGYRFNMDFEDSSMCLAKFDSGTVALINVGWFSQQYTLKIDLLGSVRNVNAQHSPATQLRAVVQTLATGMQKFNQSHLDEIRYFVGCLINDLHPSPNGQDGLKDLEAISLAYQNRIILE